MSVKMALAKLCACACGGAVIGGGAVSVTRETPRVHHVKPHKKIAKVHRAKRVHYARRVVRKVRRTVQYACATGSGGAVVTTVASRAPLPLMLARDAAYDRGSGYDGGGGAVPIVIGGSGGFGGGGFFAGGFGGGGFGGGGSGGSIIITSTSSGSISTSGGSSSTSGGSTSTSGGSTSSLSSSRSGSKSG